MNENIPLTNELEQTISQICNNHLGNIESYHKDFVEQDEFIFLEDFVPLTNLDTFFLSQLPNVEPSIHRNYIPGHKKGGSVSAFILNEKAPCITAFYKSPVFINFLNQIIDGSSVQPPQQSSNSTDTENKLQICAESDPHAAALYYYTEEGDHIGFHYDTSFYNGKRFTVLIGLVDDSSCELVCHLYTKSNPKKETVIKSVRVKPGALVLFNGDRLYHCVTPLKRGERRIVLTLEYVTNREMTLLNRTISNMKDAVAYFGVGGILQGMSKSESPISNTNMNEKKHIPTLELKHNIVAFVNKLSGGQLGKNIIPQLRDLLGEENVIDLNQMGGPESGLSRYLHTNKLRVVACGGDGTIRWVIQGLINLGFDPLPPLGVIPIGTGNDLSRMFGWGSTYPPKDKPSSTDPYNDLVTFIKNIDRADYKPMDIWTCTLTPLNPQTGELRTQDAVPHVMFNYFNIGFDAQVALGFHSLRTTKPHLFTSPFVNKCWYFLYAVQNVVWKGSPFLNSLLDVKVDDKPIEIPDSVKTLVVLNFVCYQAGTDIWGSDADPDNVPKMDDQTVEVVGINGVVHETMVRLYVSAGIRLGRGKRVSITVKKPEVLPMAFDGEPFSHEPAVIDIQSFKQLSILVNPDFIHEKA